eukprot:s2776_g13.t1
MARDNTSPPISGEFAGEDVENVPFQDSCVDENFSQTLDAEQGWEEPELSIRLQRQAKVMKQLTQIRIWLNFAILVKQLEVKLVEICRLIRFMEHSIFLRFFRMLRTIFVLEMLLNIVGTNFGLRREADLQRALKKWMVLIESWPSDWNCVLEVSNTVGLDASLELVADYLAGKAPATLVKRANSMAFVMNAATDIGIFFPFSEPDFYHLLKVLRQRGHSCSKLKSVLEAITFVRYPFQIDVLHPLTCSKRCAGAVMPEPVGRILQAEPLRVKDLERLHGVLDSGDLWDRVFAGACLFCAYARARWSDFVHGNYLRNLNLLAVEFMVL